MSEEGFNADDFLYEESTQELDTKYIPVPQGEYEATVEKVEARSGTTEKTPSGRWAMLNLRWAIEDDEVKQATQREKNSVQQTIFLDLDENGKLDFGPQKNIGLGKIYDAVGLPTKGSSPNMLQGQMAKVRVKHSPIQGTDDMRAEVSAVKKL